MHITIAFVSLTIATAGCGSPKMGNDSGKEPAGTAMPSKGELVQPGQAVPNIRMLDEKVTVLTSTSTRAKRQSSRSSGPVAQPLP